MRSALYYHGAPYYIPWLCRRTAIDPMEAKYAGMSPYNYAFNNPVMWNDLSGASPGWVDTGDGGEKIIYNSNIGSQEAAQAVYGDNAQFYGASKEEYKGSDGSKYILSSNGSYSKDGTTYTAKDHASLTDHYAIIDLWLQPMEDYPEY